MLGSTHRLAVTSLIVLFACAAMTEAAGRRQRGKGRAAAPQDETGKALMAALEDERKSQAFYKAILAKHGQIMPFANIVRAEGMHESALLGLMKKYNVPVPADKYLANPPQAPATVAEAIRQSIQAEKENVALYDRILKSIQQEDIKSVMGNLRWASQERHLPALERHAAGGGGGGGGCGACGAGGGRGPGGPGGPGAGGGGGGGGHGWRGGRGQNAH